MKRNLQELIICPICFSGDLEFTNKKIKCLSCKSEYDILNGIFDLVTPKDKIEINRLSKFTETYSRKKRVSKTAYKFLKLLDKVYIPSLTYHLGSANFSDRFSNESLVLNIGGKDKRAQPNMTNMDILPNKYTSILGNVERIPFKDNSFDFVNITAVFHHLKKPEKAVKEIHRVLKKGGCIYAEDHFFYKYHADPIDCHRWTKEGYRLLFEDFKEIKLKMIHGPTAALLKFLQIYLPTLFSFNSVFLYELEYIFFSYTLYPFKFLDIFLKNGWKSDFIAGGYGFLGRKE